MKVAQYPRDADGRPMDLMVGVITDASGNSGARLTNRPAGPDNSPIDTKGLILVDSAGNLANMMIGVNNLSEITNAATARSNLGIPSAIINIITPKNPAYGAVGDGVTNDTAALNAFMAAVFDPTFSGWADFSGVYAVAGQQIWGPTTVETASTPRRHIGGEMNVVQLTAGTWETVRLRNWRSENFQGRISVTGTGAGDGTLASRSCGVGIALEACRGTRWQGGLRAYNFWYAGIVTPVINNNMLSLGTIECVNCGSGQPGTGATATANWSAIVNSGTQGSGAQRSQVTVDSLPPVEIENYETVLNQQLHVRINGTLYKVKALDRVNNTLSLYSWIDNTIGATGTLEYIWGAGFLPMLADGNDIGYDCLIATSCSRAIGARCFYGVKAGRTVATTCGQAVCVGGDTGSSQLGNVLDSLYIEIDCTEHIVFSGTITDNHFHYMLGCQTLDLNKVFSLAGPRNASNVRVNDTLLDTSATGLGKVTIAHRGKFHCAVGRNLNSLSTTSINYKGQSEEPRIYTQVRDSQTINLQVLGEYFNRLFGYRGGTLRFIGTGTNGAPTGSFTFVPAAGGSINGGVADASVVISGPYNGPLDVELCMTSTNELNWSIYATNLATSDASKLTTGTMPVARMPAMTGGDVTSPANSGALSIGANKVTRAMMANMAAAGVLGATAAGAVAELTPTQLATMLGVAAPYRTIVDASGSHTAAQAAGTYGFGQGQALLATGVGALYPLDIIYIDSADYPNIGTLAAKLRIRCNLAVNDVAPTGNFVVGLHPISRPATSGGVGVNIYTIGAAVTGSTLTFTTPAADALMNGVSADFALPANGFYALGMVSSAAVAASSHLDFSAALQLHHA